MRPSIYTKIINREIPAGVVWENEELQDRIKSIAQKLKAALESANV